MKPILSALVENREKLTSLRERILANAVMFGELPAPTFGEERRVRFLCDRFEESDLQNISSDEAGNGTAILPGTEPGTRSILIVAHTDTVFATGVDHTVKVGADRLEGPGIADNTLGLAVMASLPAILRRLGIHLKSDLVLLGASQGTGRGNLAGLRFFLDHYRKPLNAGVCVEGVHLGRLSYSCIGMLRAEITCHAPVDAEWDTSVGVSAIANMTKILTRILAIPTPQVPKTSIILGSVNSGTAFNTPATNATLQLEVRSEEAGAVRGVRRAIGEMLEEISAETGTRNEMELIARRHPGGIGFSHPLVKSTRQIMEKLKIRPKIAPSVGELSALIAHGIPAVTLGITKGDNCHEFTEYVEINPIFSGIAQLVGVLQAIDEGVCDEN
jgi:acetylornithine deacetylase/succinyl-diaminopimelate desuccinylase-like protein